MTKSEMKQIILDVFAEYLPKSVAKDARADIAASIVAEFEEHGLDVIDDDGDEDLDSED